MGNIEKITQMKLKSIVNFDDEDMMSHTSKVRKNISRVQSNATVKRTPAIHVNFSHNFTNNYNRKKLSLNKNRYP